MTARIRDMFQGGSVRTRLMLWNIGTLALILVVLGGIVQYTVQSFLLASVDRDLTQRARQFTDRRRPPGPRGPGPDQDRRGPWDRPPPGPGPEPFGGPPPGMLRDDRPPFRPMSASDAQARARDLYWPRVLDSNGRTVAPFEGLQPWDPEAFRAAAKGGSFHTTVTVNDETIRVYSFPARREGGRGTVIQIPDPLADIERSITGVKRTLLTLIPVALLLAGVGGAALTGRALAPVGQIADATERIGAHDLSQRLRIAGNDEFTHLGTTINGMLARLEDAFDEQRSLVSQLDALLEQQRRFTADASHELKTPLTIIKANTSLVKHSRATESELRESLEEIDCAADRMARLVHDLLFLARQDAGYLAASPVDIPVAEALAHAVRRQKGASGLSVGEVDPSLHFRLDADDLARILDNLTENAIRYTPPGGTVTLSAKAEGQHVAIEVRDTGIGIAPEHLAHLSERFYRVDDSRARNAGGAGLGLAICKSIVEGYGGSLSIDSHEGKGTTVIVRIPGVAL